MLVTSAPQDTSALHGFGGAGAPLSILALTLCQAVLSSHASSADLKLPRADAEELGANAKAGQLSPAPTMACGRTALGFGECRELPAPPPRWGDAHRMAGGSGPSSSEVRSVHVPRCWWNMTADPCCDGCDYHMCCLWPSLLRLTWQEFLQPCAARGAAACEELAVRAEREAIALAPRFAAAHQAGEVDAATRFLVLLQARLILLAVLGFFSLLEAASAVLESASSGLTYSFAQDKDPDPCYCGHGLGLHEATKNVFVELMAAPRFRERMLEPMDMTNTFIRFQSCELLAPTAEWPIEHMLTLVVNAECVPSHLVTVLICAQQRILHQDLLRAFLFAVAALMGASFVPRCLTGARTGSRSAWPFTLSDVARHVRSIFGVLTAGGDPHDAAWTSGPLEEQEAPRPDSPCMQELAGACVVSGELHTLVSDVRYCDEEGVHTLEVEPHQSVKQADGHRGAGAAGALDRAVPEAGGAVGGGREVSLRGGRVLRLVTRWPRPFARCDRVRSSRAACALSRIGPCCRRPLPGQRHYRGGFVFASRWTPRPPTWRWTTHSRTAARSFASRSTPSLHRTHSDTCRECTHPTSGSSLVPPAERWHSSPFCQHMLHWLSCRRRAGRSSADQDGTGIRTRCGGSGAPSPS
mmetsp:Transcript_169638/g.538611  ORF Transcript_169638/g.538611 Transcript_169638/m.538611 type:complete len:639 (+) Transcript_169638:48-1964(+)